MGNSPLDRLKTLAEGILRALEKGEDPVLSFPSRRRHNVRFSEGKLGLGERSSHRRLTNLQQVRKFAQTLAVAAKCKEYLENQKHVSLRGLYYQLRTRLPGLREELFSDQRESNPVVEDLEALLGVLREELNLTTDRRGVVAGPMKILDHFGGEDYLLDLRRMGRSGWMIPSDVDGGLEFLEVRAKAVLVVEKDAIWQRLNEDRFWEKEEILLVSPKGQPSRGCRRFLRKLADLGLPVLVFTDADPWGWYIYWTIKTGSINLAHANEKLAVPEAVFLGLSLSEAEASFLKEMGIPLTKRDLRRAQELLSCPWISSSEFWKSELEFLIRAGYKVEQDALLSKGLHFLGDYLTERLARLSSLP